MTSIEALELIAARAKDPSASTDPITAVCAIHSIAFCALKDYRAAPSNASPIEALKEARELVRMLGQYAPQAFHEKRALEKDIAKFEAALAEAEAPQEPVGDWVLVPREPTEVMLKAAFVAMNETPGGQWKRMKAEGVTPRRLFDVKMAPRYRAMIAAAPQAPQEPVGDLRARIRNQIEFTIADALLHDSHEELAEECTSAILGMLYAAPLPPEPVGEAFPPPPTEKGGA